MDVADIAARLRAVFEIPPRAVISDAIALITVSVREQLRESSSPSITESLVELEKELLDIYGNSVDHNSVAHLEAFLSVLFTLRPVLPASSLISWFDHLRPALREPNLTLETKQSLQSLVASALDESAHAAESRSREFRRQLFQLYILDASGGATSAEDIVEEAAHQPTEKRVLAAWRENLEAILETDLMTSPNESFALLNVLFADSAARYPIMALVLRVFASKTSLPPIVSLSRSAFIDTLLTSLLVDKSTALFEREMITLLILIPYMAVYAPVRLRELLPTLLATLSRAICWKQQPFPKKGSNHDDSFVAETTGFVGKSLPSNLFVDNDDPGPYAGNVHAEPATPAPELEWAAVECSPNDHGLSIDSTPLFTFMYGLFPCNTIAFLRRPIIRLQELGFSSPLGMPWAYILDESEIKTKSTSLVRSHAFHPDVLFRDERSELSDPHLWGTSSGVGSNPSTDEVARLVASCTGLDYSSQGIKGPDDIVRATLERDGDAYYPPGELSSALTMRALLSTPVGFGLGSEHSVHAPLGRRGSDSMGESNDVDSFGSTPRARMRDRLYPHLAPLSSAVQNAQDNPDAAFVETQVSSVQTHPPSTYSYTYPHRSFDSPTEHGPSTSAHAQSQHEAPLLFSHAYTYTPSPLSPDASSPSTLVSPPPGRTSARGSRQSSLERGVTGANNLTMSTLMSGSGSTSSHPSPYQPAPPSIPPPAPSSNSHARHSPLAHPSPLSLSSVPLPEVSPEGSPEDDQHPEPPSQSTEKLTADDTPISSGRGFGPLVPSPQSSFTPPPPSLSFGAETLGASSSNQVVPPFIQTARFSLGPGSTSPRASPSSTPMLPSSSAPTPSSTLASTPTARSASTSKPGTPIVTPSPSLDPPAGSHSTSAEDETKRVMETLHRENVRLRDLNMLALWMREEIKKHVERLHRDRIVVTGEEMERQNLHNRLRDYKRRLAAVQDESRNLKREADKKAKNSKEWVDELQKKLHEFRREKISWTNEAVALRGKVKDAQAQMAARDELFEETRIAYTTLRTEMDYMKPKITQLEETEKQLEKVRKQVSLDESEEVKRLREDSKALHDAQEAMEKLRLVVASLEHANQELQKMVSA